MAARVQAGLERVYRLDRVADVGDFVAPGDTGEREALIVRQSVAGGIEIAVRLPSFPAAQDGSTPLDAVCQITRRPRTGSAIASQTTWRTASSVAWNANAW